MAMNAYSGLKESSFDNVNRRLVDNAVSVLNVYVKIQ